MGSIFGHTFGGPDGIGERLETWADEALDGTGVRFDDVTSWLGVEIAVAADAVGGTQRSVVVAVVDDRDGAEAMLAKLGAKGQPALARALAALEPKPDALAANERFDPIAPAAIASDSIRRISVTSAPVAARVEAVGADAHGEARLGSCVRQRDRRQEQRYGQPPHGRTASRSAASSNSRRHA